MKHIFLLLFVLPFYLPAQNAYNFYYFRQYNDTLFLSPASAKTAHIKSQKATTRITRFTSILSSNRDSTKMDTAVLEEQHYNPDGTVAVKTYSVAFFNSRREKLHYHYRNDYYYDNGELRKIIRHENDSIIDTVVISNASAYQVYNNSPAGRHVEHKMEGDSVAIEIVYSGNDTIVHRKKIDGQHGDDVWYHEYRNDYRTKVVHHDAKTNTDTCSFYNAKGELIMTIVNRYDNLDRLVVTDYYNRRDRNFDVYSARYNLQYNMTVWMPVSKKGKLTYRIVRSYNAQGLLSEVKHIPSNKHQGITDIRFDYEYYR